MSLFNFVRRLFGKKDVGAGRIEFAESQSGRVMMNPGPPASSCPLYEQREQLIANIHARLANGENVSADEIRETLYMKTESFLSNTTTESNLRLVRIAPILKYKPEMAEEFFAYFFEVILMDIWDIHDYESLVNWVLYYLEYSKQTDEEIRDYFRKQGHKGIVWYPTRVNPDGREFLTELTRNATLKPAIESALQIAEERHAEEWGK